MRTDWILIGAVIALSLPPRLAWPCQEQFGSLLDSVIAENDFETQRDLPAYLETFGPKFGQDLARLDGNSHWLEAGAGDGVAVRGYFSDQSKLPGKPGAAASAAAVSFFERLNRPLRQKARVTAVSYVMRPEKEVLAELERKGVRFLADPGDQLKFLTGRYFDEIPEAEIQKANLITDFAGIMTYAKQVDRTLDRYLRLLKDDGVLYLHLGMAERDKVFSNSGSKTLVEWLEGIPGLRVERVSPQSARDIALRITRVSKSVQVPRLRLVEASVAKVPWRMYWQE